jgi:ElaB/YqjD/DUF883 family membrane-anchored ribosome-binding protein
MSKETKAISKDMGRLAEDARALIAATADVAGEKVEEARKRLTAALEDGKEICGDVCDDARNMAVAEAKSVDKNVRDNPYQAVAIGVGVGMLIGFLVSGRCSCNRG